MSDPVNLREARKARARRDARARADANAARHGQPKSVRKLRDAEQARETRAFDAHRREPDA